MFENLQNYKIILASQSPRRQELLYMLGLTFSAERGTDIPEVYPDNLPVKEIALYLARQKQVVWQKYWGQPNNLVITADTIVAIGDSVLGKPVDRDDACQMLWLLSDNVHEVITGVVLKSAIKTVGFSATTHVWFKPLTVEQIEYYVDNYKPFDKAGGYGIQEWIGLAAISRIEGSYFNVVGLPVDQLYDELRKF
jgi:septum formation protein